jgi:protein SCO1/2
MLQKSPWRPAFALLMLVIALAACGGRPHVFGGTELAPPRPAPDLNLVDQHGQPFALGSQKGNLALIYFGYTHCPDVCPATLGAFAAARRQLGAAAEHVRFIFITVDPSRDTPEVLRTYLAQIDPAIVGLTGTPAAIARAEHDYGVYAAGERLDAVTHTDRIFLIDRAGNWRRLYPFDVEPTVLAADARALLDV